jgi:hypothetical protein
MIEQSNIKTGKDIRKQQSKMVVLKALNHCAEACCPQLCHFMVCMWMPSWMTHSWKLPSACHICDKWGIMMTTSVAEREQKLVMCWNSQLCHVKCWKKGLWLQLCSRILGDFGSWEWQFLNTKIDSKYMLSIYEYIHNYLKLITVYN